MSFLSASCGLSQKGRTGDAGSATCYPTLLKMLWGMGEEEMLKAFLSIIQQPELPVAPVGARGSPWPESPGWGWLG